MFSYIQFLFAGFVAVSQTYSCNDPTYQDCTALQTPLEREVSRCCGICNGKSVVCSHTHTHTKYLTVVLALCMLCTMCVYKVVALVDISHCVAECAVVECPINSRCVVEGGQTSCRCKEGFQRTQSGGCIGECLLTQYYSSRVFDSFCAIIIDIDECKLGVQENGHNCPINSTCNNTIGSFDCYCDSGFDMAILQGGLRRCEGKHLSTTIAVNVGDSVVETYS